MKKNYFMLAATTMMLAACAQTDVVNDIPEPQQQAISFETFANKQTRAENSSAAYGQNNLSNHHTSFYVWASKQVTDNTQSPASTKYVSVYAYDNPGTVSYDNSTWTASPLKYWDKTATSYEFYAAAPAVQNTTTSAYGWVATNTNGASGYLTFNNFVLKGEDKDNLASVTQGNDSWKDLIKTDANGTVTPNDIDLMIAAPCNVPKANYNTTAPSAVNLDFIHILSRLNINVQAAASSPTIKLTGLEVHGLKNKGTFNENTTLINNATLATGTHQRWGTATLDGTYTLAAHLGTGSNGLPHQSFIATHKYLIIPQTVTATDKFVNMPSAPSSEAYLKINYTVGETNEPFEAYYSLATAFGVETLSFNEGWQNTLNITISPVAITFTADAAVWADQENKSDNTNNESQDDLTIQ